VTASGPSPRAPRTPGEPGEVRVEGEQATLVFRRSLRHPPEAVWAAITEPEQLRIWFMTETKTDRRKGGSVEMVTGPYGVRAVGRILEWDPPRLYEHEWNALPREDLPKGESSIIRWELSPTPEGTLLVLTHRKLSPATATVFSRGLRVFLDRLGAQLDGVVLPDWRTRVTELAGS
jgi:uncharacterized protein YndB with AHSA1/START domain